MTDRRLKLIKNEKRRMRQGRKVTVRRRRASRLEPTPTLRATSKGTEAAQAKAMTAATTARQVMLLQIMAELQELDEVSPAA